MVSAQFLMLSDLYLRVRAERRHGTRRGCMARRDGFSEVVPGAAVFYFVSEGGKHV
jgi:hypothetical protein